MTFRTYAFALTLLAAFLWSCVPSEAGDPVYLVHEPAKKSAHPPLIVLLHGSGADETDMIGLWSELPDAFVVVSPRAPFADAAGGYRWYRKLTKSATEADIEASRSFIERGIDNAVKRFDADPEKIFLAGFSQGAVMVYEIALNEPRRFRGAAVLSGSLFRSALPKLSAKTNWSRSSLFVAHGTADERIAFSNATSAEGELAKLGVPREFHVYPGMHHEIGAAETKDLNAWLTNRLEIEPARAPR